MNNLVEKFPVKKELIYLDHAAVAPIHNETRKVLDEYINHFTRFGIKDYGVWAERIENIRVGVANFIGAGYEEIAFVKNTGAGISIFANGVDLKSGENVIVPNFEFPANIYPWLNLKSKGVEVKLLDFEDNFITVEKIEQAIDENTRVLAISWVEFLNGYRNDLKSLSDLCKRKSEKYGHKIYFVVDAIQGLGALELNVQDVEIDFIAADGHKWFLAMEGAGIIYCNKEIMDDIKPVSVGWKSIKDKLNFTNINFDLDTTALKFEEGSMNLAGILSLEASLKIFNEVGIKNIEKKIFELTNYAIDKLEAKGLEIVSSKEQEYRSGIVSFRVDNANEVFDRMIENKIQISKRGEYLRISPHFYNDREDIDKFIDLL